MPRPSIARFRQLVRDLRYVVSIHAAEELDDDELSIHDLESIFLTGQITQRQRDPETRQSKCVIAGHTTDGSPAAVVARIGRSGYIVVITAYRE